MAKLPQRLQSAIGKRSVYQAASDWGIPHWILRDTLSGKIDCPSPRYLPLIARGVSQAEEKCVSVEEIIEDAYADPAPDTPPSKREPALAH